MIEARGPFTTLIIIGCLWFHHHQHFQHHHHDDHHDDFHDDHHHLEPTVQAIDSSSIAGWSSWAVCVPSATNLKRNCSLNSCKHCKHLYFLLAIFWKVFLLSPKIFIPPKNTPNFSKIFPPCKPSLSLAEQIDHRLHVHLLVLSHHVQNLCLMIIVGAMNVMTTIGSNMSSSNYHILPTFQFSPAPIPWCQKNILFNVQWSHIPFFQRLCWCVGQNDGDKISSERKPASPLFQAHLLLIS